MNRVKTLLWLLLWLSFLLSACSEREKRVLVFYKTTGFRHVAAIENGKDVLHKLGQANGIAVDTTQDASMFNEDTLKNYSAVVFLNTTGNPLNHVQQADFERFIQAGGGFVGIHAAADTEYKWPWYGKLVGGYFNGHPSNPNVREGKLTIIDHNHPATKGLPDELIKNDEFYNYKEFNEAVNVLLTVDEKSYGAGKHGDFHPLGWYHEYDGGRAFYIGLGHTGEMFDDEHFQHMIMGALDYAIGENKLNYDASKTARVPEENRFVKKVFATHLEEPMELEVLDNDKVLFVERKGAIKLYEPEKEAVRTIAQLDVHTKYEDGLLGLALDPNFERNYWLYLFYSPKGDEPIQRVSRFVMLGDSLILSSEKTIIEIPVQREQCCHSAGSIEFGPDGNLFIAVGDNTSPFNTKQTYDTDGFGPMDERPGRSPFDAQKSSGNTNDLRGKILRITPLPEGGYDIPEGNLFPTETGIEGRPEIYVMGCRNPYRIAVDSKNGWLFWGDVGPDAGEDKPERGPRGYDEFNIATSPGYYGWPYFVGNNYAYKKMDYNTGETGEAFDPKRPINTSPNNTGSRVLPPARPATIWYPYATTKQFEDMGSGGRNAMAGATYYYDQYEGSKNRFPEYYHGKAFHYDWMRNWIHAVTLDEEGNYVKHEPFLTNFVFSNLIDMQFAKDGTLYVLEYGKNWFSENPDAVLAQIDYADGNRHPQAKIEAEKLIGAAPFKVKFSAGSSFDYDVDDELSYEWYFTDGTEAQANGKETSFTFEKPGIYKPTVRVIDEEGAYSEASLEIQVGNEPPKVDILLSGNSSFYWEDTQLNYQVEVTDKEDQQIASEDVRVYFDYMPIGEDLIEVELGHKQKGALLDGKSLIEEKGCKSCHAYEKKSIGPSYRMVAERYETTPAIISKLANKVVKGGGGVWGERMMAAHPSLTTEEAETMIEHILALDEQLEAPSLPTDGMLAFEEHKAQGNIGNYLLKAVYTDKGGEVVGPIKRQKTLKLRYPRLQAEDYDGYHNLSKRRPAGTSYTHLDKVTPDSWFMFKEIDLTGIKKVTVRNGSVADGNFTFQIRKGAPDGEVIGAAPLPFTDGSRTSWSETTVELQPTKGQHDLYFTVKYDGEDDRAFVTVDWLYFHQPPDNRVASLNP